MCGICIYLIGIDNTIFKKENKSIKKYLKMKTFTCMGSVQHLILQTTYQGTFCTAFP